MFDFIKHFLKKPIYLQAFISNKLILSIAHGLFIYLFLIIFKPFNLTIFKEHLSGFILLMALLCFIVPFVTLVVVEKINVKKWTLGKVILLCFVFILALSIINWSASGIYKSIFELKTISFLFFYGHTTSAAIFSILFVIFINDTITKLKTKKITVIKEIIDLKNEEIITIFSDNKKESLGINIHNLVYITAEGNYANFFIKQDNDELKEKILRITLSRLAKELSKYTFILRCHKSFIVNTSFITEISGNARGYLLKSKIISFDIPVSRSFKKDYLMSLIP